MNDLKESRSASHGTAFFSRRIALRLGLERLPATARLASVGIRNLETTSGQAVHKVDYGAAQVISANRVDYHGHAMKFRRQVILPFFVKDHAVLHAGTTARFDIYAQPFSVTFRLLREHRLDLGGGAFRDFDN